MPASRTDQMRRAFKWRRAGSDVSLSSRAVGYPAQGGYRSGHGNLRPGGHYNALPPTSQILGTGWEDMVHYQARGVGEVPDGLSLMV